MIFPCDLRVTALVVDGELREVMVKTEFEWKQISSLLNWDYHLVHLIRLNYIYIYIYFKEFEFTATQINQ